MEELLSLALGMQNKLSYFNFNHPVDFVYAPLDYAWGGYKSYITNFAPQKARGLFIGMNPGPFGMAQTGIPFGDVVMVREWMEISCEINTPEKYHANRPITGFNCTRREVSGSRLWGLFRDRFFTPENFFKDYLVINYCPLMFLEKSGRNLTPEKLPKKEREQLIKICDAHLAKVIQLLQPIWLIGIGVFATQAIKRVNIQLNNSTQPKCCQILHPSPANPKANLGWADVTSKKLIDEGIW